MEKTDKEEKPIEQSNIKKSNQITMKRGDYNVHVLVSELKNLLGVTDE